MREPLTFRAGGTGSVVVFVDDSPASLSALLVAAEVARLNAVALVVISVDAPTVLDGLAALAVPWAWIDQARRDSRDSLRGRVASLVELVGIPRWEFVEHRGSLHRVALAVVRQLDPLTVVVGAPRRRPRLQRSLARWLVGRPRVPAVVVPA